MAYEVACPQGHRLQVTPEHAGRQVQCPLCQVPFVVPPPNLAGMPGTSGLSGPGPGSGPGIGSPAGYGSPSGAAQPALATATMSPATAVPTAPATATATAAPGTQVYTGSPSPAAPAAEEDRSALSRARTLRGHGFDSLSSSLLGKVLGVPILCIGLILVLFARGCDDLASRDVTRLRAHEQVSHNNFDDEWEFKRMDLDARLETEPDTVRRAQLQADHAKEQNNARRLIERGTWRTLRVTARDAATSYLQWSYWFRWMFLVGTILLSLGLLIVGFSGQGAERWICLAMLAIITFSVYIGGLAWVDPQLSTLKSLGP